MAELLNAVKEKLKFIINELIKQSSNEEILILKNDVINRYTKSFQANAVILTPRERKGKILSYKLNSTLKRLLPTPIDKIGTPDMKQMMSRIDTIYDTVNISGGPKKQIREYLQIVDRQGQQGGALKFDDLDLEELKYGFYSYLYNYFDYVGAAVYDIGFLTYLFKLFYENKELPTLDEFEDIYSKRYKNTLKQYLDQYNKNVSETENVSEEVSLLEQSNIFLDKLDQVIDKKLDQVIYRQTYQNEENVPSKKRIRLFQDPTLQSGPASNSQVLPTYKEVSVKPMEIDGELNKMVIDEEYSVTPMEIDGQAGPAFGGNKHTKRFRQRHKYKKSKKINKKQNKKKTRKVKKNTRKFKKNTLRKEN